MRFLGFLISVFCITIWGAKSFGGSSEIIGKFNNLRSYPDLFSALTQVDQVGPELLASLSRYVESECQGRLGEQLEACEFIEKLKEFNGRDAWLNSFASPSFTSSSSQDLSMNLVSIPRLWTAVDIQSLNWGLGLDVPPDTAEEWAIVESVLGWLYLQRKLLENTQVLRELMAARSVERARGDIRITTPLVEAWLSSPFIFQRVLRLAEAADCKKLPICAEFSESLTSLVEEQLAKYQFRLADIVEAIHSDSIYYGPQHESWKQWFANRRAVEEYLQNGQKVSPAQKSVILAEVSLPPSFTEERLSELTFLAMVQELSELHRDVVPPMDKRSSSQLPIGPHRAEDYPGYRKLRALIETEIKTAIRFFENRFANNQRDLKP